jgi:hypothetical protein
MDMQNRLRSEPLASPATFYITVLLQLCLERLDMSWRELAQRDVANAWCDLALNKLTMANRCLPRNPPLNIYREPML